MKVRIDFTIEVDPEVVRVYMDDHLENDETMKELLVTWYSYLGTAKLDESIRNAISKQHTTMVARQDY